MYEVCYVESPDKLKSDALIAIIMHGSYELPITRRRFERLADALAFKLKYETEDRQIDIKVIA